MKHTVCTGYKMPQQRSMLITTCSQ